MVPLYETYKSLQRGKPKKKRTTLNIGVLKKVKIKKRHFRKKYVR